MNTYNVGDPVQLYTSYFTTVDVDPSTVALTVELPTGVETTYTFAGGQVTKDSTGHYHMNYVTTMAGIHTYGFTSTGTAAGHRENRFEVRVKRVA